jgi:hypothetical protein
MFEGMISSMDCNGTLDGERCVKDIPAFHKEF